MKGLSRTGIRNNDGQIVGEKWILTNEQVEFALGALEHYVTGDPRKRAKAEARRGNIEWEALADFYEKLTGEHVSS